MQDAFAASDRFELRGLLGSGGMGAVYRVLDRPRNREVALKVLKAKGGRELYRFKREFRALADLAHPNLVKLHELYTVGDEWMFTMELVDGVPFTKWVRPPSAALSAEPILRRSHEPLDEQRLEDALYQLADGLMALHAAGKLHRDLKPSNVLVEPSGRVVILDFGLIADLDTYRVERTHDDVAVGTPAYMSPEQAADQPLTYASDWYSVGCILYEALTRRRPFDGTYTDVIHRKQDEMPSPPSEAVGPVSPRLERLCMQLLATDPAHRPDGAAVIAALGRAPSEATERIANIALNAPFVGRNAELGTLQLALTESQQHCVVTLALGASGMGKSSLLHAFLDEAATDREAVILQGRCYQRETVPFKLLDQVVDALTAFLVGLSPDQLVELLPADVSALVRLFPVMRRVPGMDVPRLPGAAPGDPVELRGRAFHALRDILTRITERRHLVIAIDDLQWGDIDGAWGLAQLMAPPAAPHMLVVMCHRLEDAEQSVALYMLRRWLPSQLRELTVGALPARDAEQLWTALGGDLVDVDVLRDSAGNPLLISEIAWAQRAGNERVRTVEDAVLLRVEQLDDDSRALLHAVAIASQPMRPGILAAAAGVTDPTAPLAALRDNHLIRVGAGTSGTVEAYHDRIRESVLAAMSDAERRAGHGQLARALCAAGIEGELVVEHWMLAGDRVRAAEQAELAARDSEERFAFHRAADLYELALRHGEMDAVSRCDLTARHADTLTAAGRLVEAADEYRVAASLAEGRAKFALERRSVEQQLRAGHIVRGLNAAGELLDAVGVSMPTTWRRTLLAFVIERARIRMRSLDFKRRDEQDIDPDRLARLDVLWSMSSGFSLVQPLLGRVMQARLLREALAAGEPRRVAQAYGLELGYVSIPGHHARDRSERLLARARSLADEIGAPDVRGFVEVAGGLASYLSGHFREAHERFIAGEQMMRQRPADVRWALDLTAIFRIATLWCLGELRELERLQREYLRAAEERGNVFIQRGLRGWRSNVVWLIRGEPAEARRQAERASPGHDSIEPFTLQHYYDLIARTMIDLYQGDGDPAWARLASAWHDFEHSHLQRIQLIDTESHWLRGTAAIAVPQPEPRRLEVADACVRHLRKIGSPYSRVLSGQLCAATLLRRGQRERAIEVLRATIAAAERAEISAHCAAARMRLGLVVGGDEGRDMVTLAERWLLVQGVADPRAFAAMLSPGLAEAQ